MQIIYFLLKFVKNLSIESTVKFATWDINFNLYLEVPVVQSL